jgi:hypothetical protein
MGKLGRVSDERGACVARLGNVRSGVLRRAALGVLPLALAVAGCSGSGPDSASGGDVAETVESTTPPTPKCSESRHIAVFDYFGFLSMSDEDLRTWLDDPADAPDPRPGAAATVSAYRSLGYEIAYLTTVPVNMMIGEQPIDDAIRTWLSTNGFPGGEGTTIMTWETGDAIVGITNQLLRFAGQDISVDAGYTDNADKAYAIITGGVPADHMYTIGSGSGAQGSRAIPGDDVVAHAENVAALPKVCEA